MRSERSDEYAGTETKMSIKEKIANLCFILNNSTFINKSLLCQFTGGFEAGKRVAIELQ
jgi:nickel-dependent lactate racemase